MQGTMERHSCSFGAGSPSSNRPAIRYVCTAWARSLVTRSSSWHSSSYASAMSSRARTRRCLSSCGRSIGTWMRPSPAERWSGLDTGAERRSRQASCHAKARGNVAATVEASNTPVSDPRFGTQTLASEDKCGVLWLGECGDQSPRRRIAGGAGRRGIHLKEREGSGCDGKRRGSKGIVFWKCALGYCAKMQQQLC